MDHPDYQKHLVAALQQQRDQATNQTAHLAALVSIRDSEIAAMKEKANKLHREINDLQEQIKELKPKETEVTQ